MMSSHCSNMYILTFGLQIISLWKISDAHAQNNLLCPVQSHWKHRADTLCKSSGSYFCLYDQNRRNFTEFCSKKAESEKKGFKLVIRGAIDGQPCERHFYQPFKFSSDGNSGCVYNKSLCTEEGQVIYKNWNSTSDSLCRCDNTRGYDFIHRPQHRCYCVQSTEDCSCYFRKCSSSEFLSQDYECLNSKTLERNIECTIDRFDGTEDKSTVISADGDIDQDGTNDSFSWTALIVTLWMVLFILVVCAFMFGSSLKNRQVQNEVFIHYSHGEQMVMQTRNKGFNTNESSRIIPSNLLGEKEITKWRKRHEYFEVTHGSTQVLKTVKTHGFVILSGPPGSGKSAIAYHTAFMLEMKAKFTIVPVSSPEEIQKYLLPETKQVFIIDDPVGKYSVDDSIIQQWEKEDTFIEQTFTDSLSTKLILTCRSYIYNSWFSRQLNISPKHIDLLSNNMKLSMYERRQICKRYNVPELNEDTIMMYDFLPLLCAIFSEHDDTAMFFVNPNPVLTKDIISTKDKSDTAFLAIALLVVQNNNIDRELLSFENHTIKELLNDMCNECGFKYFPSTTALLAALHHLIGSYLTETDDGFACIHDTLFKNLSFIVGSSIIHCLLKYGNSTFIANRLQLSSILKEHDDLVIIVKPEQEELYFQRLLLDIKKGNHNEVFNGIQMKNSRFRSKLLSFLKRLNAGDLTCDHNNSTPLHVASEQGYIDLVQLLLKMKKDQIIHQDRHKRTPMYLACLGGHDDVVKELHLQNNNTLYITTTDGCTPLDAASSNGHYSTVKLLLKYGANYKKKDNNKKRTPLYSACENGHYNVVRLLLEKNPDVKYIDVKGLKAIHIACYSGHLEIVELLLSYKDMINECDDYDRTPLFIACENNHQMLVDKLLEYNANVNQTNKQNITPLYKACENRNENIVGRLLNNNAKVNVQSEGGLSPLYIACFNGQNRIVDILLDKKADVNIANKQGCTPFFISCSEDHLEICKVLQQKGANINTAGTFAFTPLHVACREKRYRIVRFLLDYNANVNAVNRQKESSLYISCMNESLEIIELLLGNNADVKLCDEQGNSPLHAACLKGNRKIVQLLLDK